MNNQLFVGGIAWGTTEEGLKSFFEAIGEVEKVRIITDRDTNRSKGFGFVTMAAEEDATKAIDELDGKELDGRSLRVNQSVKKDS